jgi:hypothetical protein
MCLSACWGSSDIDACCILATAAAMAADPFAPLYLCIPHASGRAAQAGGPLGGMSAAPDAPPAADASEAPVAAAEAAQPAATLRGSPLVLPFLSNLLTPAPALPTAPPLPAVVRCLGCAAAVPPPYCLHSLTPTHAHSCFVPRSRRYRLAAYVQSLRALRDRLARSPPAAHGAGSAAAAAAAPLQLDARSECPLPPQPSCGGSEYLRPDGARARILGSRVLQRGWLAEAERRQRGGDAPAMPPPPRPPARAPELQREEERERPPGAPRPRELGDLRAGGAGGDGGGGN